MPSTMPTVAGVLANPARLDCERAMMLKMRPISAEKNTTTRPAMPSPLPG